MPSIVLNGMTLNFTSIFYIDATNGVDSASRAGSLTDPFKTVNWTITNKCAATGCAIYALEGTHDVTNMTMVSSYDGGGLYDQGKAISFFGKPGKTIFVCDGTKFAGYYCHCVQLENDGSRIYDIIFNYNAGNRYSNYDTSIFTVSHAITCKGQVHNCVFKITSPVAPSATYCNAGTNPIKVYNCLFIVTMNWQGSYTGAGGNFYNCACNYNFYNEGTRTTCLNGVTYDAANYKLTSGNWQNTGTGTDPDGSVADIGVYGGTFKWITEILKFLIQDGSSIKKYNSTTLVWDTIGSDPVTPSMFDDHGVLVMPNMSDIAKLNEPQLLAYSSDATIVHQMKTTIKVTEVYYLISMDGITWYSRLTGSWLQTSDIYNDGMSKNVLEAITESQFTEIFVPGSLYVKVCLKSNDTSHSPHLDSVSVTLPLSYKVGNYYIMTGNGMSLNMLDWKSIQSVLISQNTPVGTGIRYAFSKDGRISWNVYNGATWINIPINEVTTNGMTELQVESLTELQWSYMVEGNAYDKLDMVICLMNVGVGATPSIDQITFAYTKITPLMTTSSIDIPVPDLGFRNILQSDDSYVLRLAEGIVFDDASVDYNFYTTSDKIKIRPLDMGTLIGGKDSAVSKFELINAFDGKDFFVKVTIWQDGAALPQIGNHTLLNDATREDEKTLVELSLQDEEHFTAIYPLTFYLDAGEKRVMYIRITPTIATSGKAKFQICATVTPL